MNHLIDDEELPRHERELTLSSGAILGIFLGLAVLCGAFFGFGYNMGRKSAPTPLTLAETTPDATLSGTGMGGTKPSAGLPTEEATPAAPAPVTSTRSTRRTPPPQPITDPTTAETVAKPTPTRTAPVTPTPAPIVRQPAPVSPSALSPSAAPTATATSGSYMVQVAAVSHQDDANLLLGALRARGYAVSAHNNTGDSFIHIQVGPFHDKKEADAMRQRLITDGYNAIVKQ